MSFSRAFVRAVCSAVALLCFAHRAPAEFALSWTNNLLTVSGPELPGGKLEIWYLEAFCRKGAANQKWDKTTFPHKTILLSATANRLRFRTDVEPRVQVLHGVTADADEIRFEFEFKNQGTEPAGIEWFQPACIRVERFTGTNQSGYISRSFIFTRRGLTTLDKTRRTEEALYRGGQVYLPQGINPADANPRPLNLDNPTNGLIGCFSADQKFLLATASDCTHELFEGVYVCLHSDPLVGGLAAGETRRIRSKIYIVTNDVNALLTRYRKDFPANIGPTKK
jgi:hypothetical protein